MNGFFQRLGMNGIVRLRWLWVLLIAAAAVPAVLGIGRLTMDSSNESFMPENDPVTVKNDEFKEIFGSEEFFFILVEADDIYSTETLGEIRDLQADLEENLPFVDEVTSIYSSEFMESDGFFLNIESMEDSGIPETPEERELLKEKHVSSLLFRDRLISEDGEAAGIFISLEELPERVYARTEPGYGPFKERYHTREMAVLADDISPDPGKAGELQLLGDPRKDAAATLLTLLDDHRSDDFRLTATGLPIIDYGSDSITGKESSLFGGLSLAMAALLLIFLYRDLRALLAPLLVFLLTTLFLFGFMGIAGMGVSIMSIVIVPLLVVISVGYSVHMINQTRKALFAGMTGKEAVSRAYAVSAWPCLLTAVTTAAGFLSFLFVPMRPIRQLGMQCALGTMIAFLLVMVVVPLFFLPGKARKRENRIVGTGNDRWVDWNSRLYRNGKAIIAGAAVVGVLAVWGATKIRPSSDMMDIIGERAEFVRDSQHVSGFLGGTYSAEFLIELPEPDMACEPEVLEALDAAAEIAGGYEQVNLTLSLADLVLELDRAFMGKDPEEASIPDRKDTIAQYLLLYETSGGEVLDDWTDLEYRTLRLSVLLGGSNTGVAELDEEVGGYLRNRLPQGTKVTMTGDLPVMMRMMDLLIQSQVRSCLAALAFIALLLVLILRSPRLGGLAVIPNIFPILVNLGLMGWLGISLDFVTAMIAPMLIGIAVDDTVHFFVHYRRIRSGAAGPEDASEKTFLSVGNALVFTSVVLAGGFVILGLSRVKSLQHLGILATAGIAAALFADICLSPLLLKRFDIKGKNGGNNEKLDENDRPVLADA